MNPYDVPGSKVVLAQPTSRVCWATVYTMMASWKQQQSMAIRDAVAAVGSYYGQLFDQNRVLMPADIPLFMGTAGLTMEPMMNQTLDAWTQMLRHSGLLWVGTLNSDGSGRHARIIEGVYGDGSTNGSYFKIIDPDGGRRYNESFGTFVQKYEGAFTFANDVYYQIRHF